MNSDMKLYKITLQGMHIKHRNSTYGTCYVIASNPSEAYDKVRTFLDKEDLGFLHERELDTIELIAENKQYTDAPCILYI